MSLSEQLQRVDGGQIAALKALIQKYGGTVPEGTKIDGYANIINGLGIYSQQEMLSNETAEALGLPSTAVPDDAFKTIKRIEFGSYVGTGTYGENSPNTLTFDFEPKLVIVPSSYSVTMMRAYTQATAQGSGVSMTERLTWGENSVSWYGWGPISNAEQQQNWAGSTYYYMAIG